MKAFIPATLSFVMASAYLALSFRDTPTSYIHGALRYFSFHSLPTFATDSRYHAFDSPFSFHLSHYPCRFTTRPFGRICPISVFLQPVGKRTGAPAR